MSNSALYESFVREAWFRGNLRYKLHAAQKIIDDTFKNAPGQLFVGNTARQWGKTYWAVTKAIETAIKVPKAQIRYGAAFQTDLVDYIIPAFDKIFEDCPDQLKGVYKTQGSKYVFPNGSVIKLVGLDKHPNGLRGNTLDLIVIDECGFVNNLDYLYKSVIIPATTHRPNCRIVLISTPPATPAHSFVDYCQKAETEGGYATFTIYQNPRIDENTIERLAKESGGKDSTFWRREYMCEFVTDDDSRLTPEFKDEFIQDYPKDEFYNFYHKYVGMDLGVKDWFATLYGYWDFKNARLIIEDEGKENGPKMNTQTIVNSIKSKEETLWGKDRDPKVAPYRRIADNNWPLIILDMQSIHKMSVIATEKGPGSLEAGVNELRLMLQQGQIIIHPRCKYLIGCLKYGVWDDKKKSFAKSTAYGHYDHLAALVYLVRNLSKNANPIPNDYKHTHRTWVPPVKKNTEAVSNLKKALLPKKLR